MAEDDCQHGGEHKPTFGALKIAPLPCPHKEGVVTEQQMWLLLKMITCEKCGLCLVPKWVVNLGEEEHE